MNHQGKAQRPGKPRSRSRGTGIGGYRRRALHIEFLEDRCLLAVVSWIDPAGGAWEVGSNWSNGTGPGPADDALIDIPGITVVHSTGSDTVQSLTSNDAFTLSGGTLTVTGNVQEQNGNPFTLAGGTLAGATVASGTTLTGTSSGGTLNNVTLAGTLDVGNGVVTVTDNLTLASGAVSLDQAGLLTFAGTQTLGGPARSPSSPAPPWCRAGC